MNSTGPTSPLRGRYLIQNPVWNAAFTAIDGALAIMHGGRAPGPVAEPRRILLANGAHIGDVVIATSVIRLVRATFPKAEIGLLVASWGRVVVSGHPDIRRVHIVDHWWLNRGNAARSEKVKRYVETRRVALREIREVGYDVAIDLYPFFPNTIPLLKQAGIPTRIGYTSGGFGPLLTHPHDWHDSDRHTAEYHVELLRDLGIPPAKAGVLRSSLPPRGAKVEGEADRVLGEHGLVRGGYVVLHMGTGAQLREWPLVQWQGLARQLATQGHALVFTGLGEREHLNAAAVGSFAGRYVNLCDRLSWEVFVSVVARARAVICVESVCSHVAAAVGTPAVVIMSGITNTHHWRPLGDHITLVMNAVPCAPCFLSRGCASMACVRGLSDDAVFDAFQRLTAREMNTHAPERRRSSSGV